MSVRRFGLTDAPAPCTLVVSQEDAMLAVYVAPPEPSGAAAHPDVWTLVGRSASWHLRHSASPAADIAPVVDGSSGSTHGVVAEAVCGSWQLAHAKREPVATESAASRSCRVSEPGPARRAAMSVLRVGEHAGRVAAKTPVVSRVGVERRLARGMRHVAAQAHDLGAGRRLCNGGAVSRPFEAPQIATRLGARGGAVARVAERVARLLPAGGDAGR